MIAALRQNKNLFSVKKLRLLGRSFFTYEARNPYGRYIRRPKKELYELL